MKVTKAQRALMARSDRAALAAVLVSEALLALHLLVRPFSRQLSQRIRQYSCGLFLST